MPLRFCPSVRSCLLPPVSSFHYCQHSHLPVIAVCLPACICIIPSSVYLAPKIPLPQWTDFEPGQTSLTLETWELALPETIVEGSARGWVTVVGDLLALSLEVGDTLLATWGNGRRVTPLPFPDPTIPQ